MKITSLMMAPGNAAYYDAKFRRLIEDHIPLLLNDPANRVITVDPMDAHRYAGDFYGLLNAKLITAGWMHWIVLRLNGYVSPHDVDENLTQFIYPNEQTINQLMSVYKTSNKI